MAQQGLSVDQALQMLEMLNQQLSNMESSRAQLQQARSEAKAAIEALNTEGEDALMPLGAGVFVRAKRKDVENCLIGVGAGLVVGATSEKAVERLEGRIENLGETIQRIEKDMEEVAGRANQLQQSLEAATQQARAGGGQGGPAGGA